MKVRTNHLIAAIIVFVLAAAYFATVQENKKAKTDQVELVRIAAKKDCARTSKRAALVVSFKERAAQAAADRHETGLAREYRALARGGLLLIPVPENREDERKYTSEIVRFVDEEGRRAYRLTHRANELIEEGCAETYSK